MVGIFLFVLLHYELVAFVAFCMPKNTCICNMYFIHHPFKGERAYSSRICGLDGCPSILFLHKPNWHFFRFALHCCLSSKWHKLLHLSAYQKDLRCWQCSINPDFDSNRPKMGLESSALSCRQEELHQHDLWDFLLCEIFPIFRTLATWVRLSNRAEECSMPGKKKTYFFLSSCLPLIHLHTLLSYIPLTFFSYHHSIFAQLSLYATLKGFVHVRWAKLYYG